VSTPHRFETKGLDERRSLVRGRRNIDRRSFLRASAAGFGATAGTGAAYSFLSELGALGSEATANKEKSKKDVPSRSLAAARCPVTGDSVSKEFSIDYRHGKLYFCSAECIDKFRADWASYQAKANAQLVATGQFRQIRCPVTGDPFALGIKLKVCGVDVRFSSPDCLKKVKRASADERVELVFGQKFDKSFASKDARTGGSAASAPDKWQCAQCGYVHKGSTPPATCPKCGAKSDAFRPVS